MLDNVKYSEWDISPLSIFITGCDSDGFIKKIYMKNQDIGDFYVNIDIKKNKIYRIRKIDDEINEIIKNNESFLDEENKNDIDKNETIFTYGNYDFKKCKNDPYNPFEGYYWHN